LSFLGIESSRVESNRIELGFVSILASLEEGHTLTLTLTLDEEEEEEEVLVC